MIVSGKKLAKEIEESIAGEVREALKPPLLGIVQVGENPVSENFIRMKREFAQRVGIGVRVARLPADVPLADVQSAIRECARASDGLIVQLPLPENLDTETVLAAIPQEKDVDALCSPPAGGHLILSPVVEAIKHVFTAHGVTLKNKRVLVIGRGRLVGAPIAEWLSGNGTTVDVIGDEVEDIAPYARAAGIIISGAGSPHLIKSSMLKEGVVLIDCGASEAGGKVLGDADPACAEKCSVFTPVPGGIGPLTVAMLFKNLLTLHSLVKK